MKTGYTLHEKVHATDWLPSLVSMATGGQDFRKFAPAGEPPYLLGDGIDVWATLSTGAPSPRDWLLLETHPAAHTVHGDAIIVGDWKIYRRGPECVEGAGAALACFFRKQARCFNAPPPFSTPPPTHTHTHTHPHTHAPRPSQLSRRRKRLVPAARPRPRDHALHAKVRGAAAACAAGCSGVRANVVPMERNRRSLRVL